MYKIIRVIFLFLLSASIAIAQQESSQAASVTGTIMTAGKTSNDSTPVYIITQSENYIKSFVGNDYFNKQFKLTGKKSLQSKTGEILYYIYYSYNISSDYLANPNPKYISVSLDKDGKIIDYIGPKKPHEFSVSRDQATQIAKQPGLKEPIEADPVVTTTPTVTPTVAPTPKPTDHSYGDIKHRVNHRHTQMIVLTADVASPKTLNPLQKHTTTWEPTPTPTPIAIPKTWVSCLYAGAQPRIINNYIFIPVASYIPLGCGGDNDVGANTDVEYALKSGFSADAIWNGTNVAPSSKEEMALFVANNISSWNGQEYGFVVTNNDNTLKGYVQDGQKNYYGYVVLGKTDGLKHNYKVTVTKNKNIYNFNWYIDGVIKGSLKYMNPTHDYTTLKYAVVGTTHKTVNWNSDGVYLKFTNISVLPNTPDF